MADETPTDNRNEQETRRVEQLSRIVAWTEPKPKPDSAGSRGDARDGS